MNCYECGGTYQEKTGTLQITDPYVGLVSVRGVLYYQCDKCNDRLYTEEMSQAIEAKITKRTHKILNQYPISEYIGATETASLLGVSRQALHKNRRISHGFIYQIKFNGNTVYLKRSVLQYKDTGDGRFSLCPREYNPLPQYLREPNIMKIVTIYEATHKDIIPKRPKFKENYVSPKENCYAS